MVLEVVEELFGFGVVRGQGQGFLGFGASEGEFLLLHIDAGEGGANEKKTAKANATRTLVARTMRARNKSQLIKTIKTKVFFFLKCKTKQTRACWR